MTAVLDRALKILELLAEHGGGMPLHAIADQLEIPRSAAHRLLVSLVEFGYVRQEREGAPYVLTIKFVALGLSYLSRNGILDVTQPILDDLAAATGELVRLSVVEDGQLVFVGKSQGARYGLRYDPDMGAQVHLASTASGLAWLATMSDEEALSLVSKQGVHIAGQLGPNAPRTIKEFLSRLKQTRKRGYAINLESFAPGTSTIAAAVRDEQTGQPLGVVSIAGPIVRLSEARMHALAPRLFQAIAELKVAQHASLWFSRRRGEGEGAAA